MILLRSATICLSIALAMASVTTARPLSEIKESGTLKVGVPGDYAPLAFYDETKTLVGFDIDLINDYAKKNNLRIEFMPTSWPTVSQDLKNNQFDIAVGGITYTDKRATEFLLSNEILPNGKIALARCSISKKLNNFDNINQPSITLVVNPGGTNESFVNERIDQANIVRVKDNFDNLQALRDQTADVMITDLIEGKYYQHNEPNVLCMATTQPFDQTESYKAYMMNQDDGELLNSVNQWLKTTDLSIFTQKWGM
ncbi:transporter substrate-binding domain-containing protein [Wohlfahrtiimonas chitiniclastica]|uniref:transporter substrate-binding domain-containing protein n=1 Tax=Wohlfahrtiimonas chitiniclastica TaxID=400946 RepID=UPI001FEDF2FF|nr:transporter substrate-binding domain-containing protein [Wohlfahrtiimonas chitiniclastica]